MPSARDRVCSRSRPVSYCRARRPMNSACPARRGRLQPVSHRHCPASRWHAAWRGARQALLFLSSTSFVFTVPHELNALTRRTAATRSSPGCRDPQDFAATRAIWCRARCHAVRHTWSQTSSITSMHCIVTGGALARDGATGAAQVTSLSSWRRCTPFRSFSRPHRRVPSRRLVCAGPSVALADPRVAAALTQLHAKDCTSTRGAFADRNKS
jgi:hypothetical protein